MATGIVKWFNAEKGFGFIEQDGGGPDVFAHYSNITASGYRELKEGQSVTFDVGQGNKARRPRTSPSTEFRGRTAAPRTRAAGAGGSPNGISHRRWIVGSRCGSRPVPVAQVNPSVDRVLSPAW